MPILKGDYIQGFEAYGPSNRIRKTRGWVNSVRTNGEHIFYDVRADDTWNGARGTILSTEYGGVIKFDEVTKQPLEERDEFTITCNRCGKQGGHRIHGVSGYGVEIECDCSDDEDRDNNTENLFW